MTRIEQMPNGSYVKRLSYLEEQIINRLYKEIIEREAADSALIIRMEDIESKSSGNSANIESMNVRLTDIEKKVSSIFGDGTEAAIDKNLKVAGYVKAPYFISTRVDLPPLEVISTKLVKNLNADTLDGKHASDFAPSAHVGKGGTEQHPNATPELSGFMSAEDFQKLSNFGPSDSYALKSSFNLLKDAYDLHAGAGGETHALATETEAGFMSADDKKAVDSLATDFVKTAGDDITGNLRFIKNGIGLEWQSEKNPGSDYARIYYVDDNEGPSNEDSKLIIEAGNDGQSTSGPDGIEIRTVTENTADASKIAIRTVKKDGTTTGGQVFVETDTLEASKDMKAEKMIMNAASFLGNNVHHFRIMSTGLDSLQKTNNGFWFDGKPITLPDGRAYARGWNIAAWNRNTESMAWVRTYDTHAQTSFTDPATEAQRMANDLNGLNKDHLVFIWCADQPSIDNNPGTTIPAATVDAVQNALYRVGASKIVKNMPYRSSYALVGRPGNGQSNGHEMFQYPDTCEMASLIVGGIPVAMGFSSGGVNVPPPEMANQVYNSGSVSDRVTTTTTTQGHPDFEIYRAYVEIWDSNMAVKKATLMLDADNPRQHSSVILDDSHTRFMYAELDPDLHTIRMVAENACYALGSVGFSHAIRYGWRIVYMYGDYSGTLPNGVEV